MELTKWSQFFDYSREPRRAIFFEDVKSNYASIECIERSLNPMTTSLCVMSRADNSNGLILAASPTFKKVFGMSNVSHSKELPFLPNNRKFNYRLWYQKHTDIFGQRTEPDPKYIAEVEYWARQTYIVPPQMLLYIKKNLEVISILREITSIDEIHAYSIDESCIDVTESLDFFFPEVSDRYEQMDKLAQLLQRKIYHQTGLYVTIGMGDNPLLAKLAMDNYAKHNSNMRALIRYEDVPNKIWNISDMTDFWGINVRTEIRLNKLGISSIKELAHADPDMLKREMGVIGLQHFFHANGIDETRLTDKYKRKSVSFSNSQTLPRDYTRKQEIKLIISEMAEQLAVRLRKSKKKANNFSLYVGFSMVDYQKSISVSRKIEATNSTNELQEIATRLFSEKYDSGAVRRIGVSANNLIDEPYQLISLFDSDETSEETIKQKKDEAIQDALDTIRKKYRYVSVQKATVLKKGSRAVARSKMVGGHSAGGLEGLE
ncbi:Y-family DNA polymerase [Lactococcus lactis]|uniref:Y-family DNA polymerase n=1 Tax=Lactococcus lactis TaxID=1358 RepID=UPI00273A5A2F|nr:Y-family DNA polymerase [Lactococcus lactis]